MVSKTGHVLAFEEMKADWGADNWGSVVGDHAGGKKGPGYRTCPYLLKDFGL